MSTPFDTLPDSGLIRQRHLLSPNGPVPYSPSTVWRQVKEGKFPAPLKLNDGHVTAWRVGDIRAWLAAQAVQA